MKSKNIKLNNISNKTIIDSVVCDKELLLVFDDTSFIIIQFKDDQSASIYGNHENLEIKELLHPYNLFIQDENCNIKEIKF